MGLDASLVDLFGYAAAGLVFLTFCMKTMVSLRLVAIASNLGFVVYALVADLMPILVLHGALLPLNIVRLVQIRRHQRLAREAARVPEGEDRFDWLIPIGHPVTLRAGEVLFRKGEPAMSLFVVTSGELRVPEVDVTLGPGALLGEFALLTGDQSRTSSAEAVTDATLAELTEQRMVQLYFEDPVFAYRLIRLVTRRLVRNLERQEAVLEARLAALPGHVPPAAPALPAGPDQPRAPHPAGF